MSAVDLFTPAAHERDGVITCTVVSSPCCSSERRRLRQLMSLLEADLPQQRYKDAPPALLSTPSLQTRAAPAEQCAPHNSSSASWRATLWSRATPHLHRRNKTRCPPTCPPKAGGSARLCTATSLTRLIARRPWPTSSRTSTRTRWCDSSRKRETWRRRSGWGASSPTPRTRRRPPGPWWLWSSGRRTSSCRSRAWSDSCSTCDDCLSPVFNCLCLLSARVWARCENTRIAGFTAAGAAQPSPGEARQVRRVCSQPPGGHHPAAVASGDGGDSGESCLEPKERDELTGNITTIHVFPETWIHWMHSCGCCDDCEAAPSVHHRVDDDVHRCNMRLFSAEEPAYMNACPEHMPCLSASLCYTNTVLISGH